MVPGFSATVPMLSGLSAFSFGPWAEIRLTGLFHGPLGGMLGKAPGQFMSIPIIKGQCCFWSTSCFCAAAGKFSTPRTALCIDFLQHPTSSVPYEGPDTRLPTEGQTGDLNKRNGLGPGDT